MPQRWIPLAPLVTLTLSWIAAGGSSTLVAAEPGSRPNVILCMADDQGWGDVAYNGHPVVKTPHLDAMAAAGLRFDRFYAAAPVCSPTRGSVMTGRTPNRFGCFKWGHSLRPQEITVAEALKQAGYTTGHFGKWHLGSVQPGSPVNPGASGFDRWFSAYNFYDNDPILSREGQATPVQGESSEIAADAAIEFMRDAVKQQRPFLAVVWFGSPHSPHQASDADRQMYAEHGKKADFYGEITGLDHAVGKLRDELRKLKVHENTLFWYCSDNGGLPGLGTTGGRANKGSIYEGGLRVPGIIEWPAQIPAPRNTNLPASTVDIYPTLLDLAGVKMNAQPPLDGVSLKTLIEGDAPASRPQPLGFWDHPTGGIGTPSDKWMRDLLQAQRLGDMTGDRARLYADAGQIKRQYPEDSFPGHAAWLDWPWKLHRMEKGKTQFELYNLEQDPNEERDLAGEESARVSAMQAELERWLASVARSLNGKDYAAQ